MNIPGNLTLRLSGRNLSILVLPSLVVYLISCTFDSSLIRVLIASFVVFLVPGVLLRLIFARPGGSLSFFRLLIEGIVLSTIIDAVLIAIAPSICTPINVTLFNLLFTALTIVLLALQFLRKDVPELSITSGEIGVLLVGFLGFILLSFIMSSIPHFYTPDETDYITNARYWLSSGTTFGVGLDVAVLKSVLISVISGRMLWIMILATFMTVTGVDIALVHLVGLIFLLGITFVSAELVRAYFPKRNAMMLLLASIIALTSPLLLEFSHFVLADLALTFIFIYSVLVFLDGLKKDVNGTPSIDFRLIFASLALQFFALQLKFSVLILMGMYFTLILYAQRNKILRRFKYYFAVLLVPVLSYEAFVDIPYVVNILLKTYENTLGYYQFLLVSPLEFLVNAFVPLPWSPQTIFSYSIFDHFRFVYRLISPEMFSILGAATMLMIPIIILSKKTVHHIRWLSILVGFTLPVIYFYSITAARFPDMPRNMLFLVPFITVFLFAFVHDVFSDPSSKRVAIWSVAMMALSWIAYVLLSRFGGATIAYSGGLRTDSLNAILLETVAFFMVSAIVARRQRNASDHDMASSASKSRLRFKRLTQSVIFKSTSRISIAILLLCFIVVSSNIYYSYVVYSDSAHFRSYGETDASSQINAILNNTLPVIITNGYTYDRIFMNESLLSRGYVAPPPVNSSELLDFLRLGLNGSLLVVHNDDIIGGYVYANDYIHDGVPAIEVKGDATMVAYTQLPPREGVQLDLNLSNKNQTLVENVTTSDNATWVDIGESQLVEFNGNNTYAMISSQAGNDSAQLSVELWFKMSIPLHEQNDWAGIVSRYRSNDPWDIVSVAGKDKLRVEIETTQGEFFVDSKKTDWVPDKWYHVGLVYDGQSLNFYIDGELDNSIPAQGTLKTSTYPLYIGRMESNYFNGYISQVRIYNRTLNSEEVKADFLDAYSNKDILYRTERFYETSEVSIYRVYGPTILHNDNEGITVREVRFAASNDTDASLELRTVSTNPSPVNAFLLVGNIRFSKVFNLTIPPGEASFSFHYTALTSTYLLEATSTSSILLATTDGGIILNDVIGANRLNVPWINVILFLGVMLFYLVLIRGRSVAHNCESKIKLQGELRNESIVCSQS